MFCFFWPRGKWDLSYSSRARAHTPCIGRWRVNHWTPRETPRTLFLAAAPKVCSRNPWWVEPFEGICEVKIIFLVILACYLLSCCHPLRIARGNFRDIWWWCGSKLSEEQLQESTSSSYQPDIYICKTVKPMPPFLYNFLEKFLTKNMLFMLTCKSVIVISTLVSKYLKYVF